tara:strand:+ start:51 stop:422 length:372 start_codon:yes stop_codon:yes gene_type:complete
MKYTKILILLFSFFILSHSYSDEKMKYKIYKNLRCLVCQGQNIGDSNSEFAQTIKTVINDKLDEGLNEREVYSFLAEKYGDWILYKPPLKNNSYVLWLLPYVIFILGALILFIFLRKNTIHKK